MIVLDVLTIMFIAAGLFFFASGTVGFLRFPDTLCRLHALTKADNCGLGLLILGLMLQQESVTGAMKLLMVWFLVLASSATGCFLVAGRVRAEEERAAKREVRP